MDELEWREKAQRLLEVAVSRLAQASVDLHKLTCDRKGPAVTPKKFRLAPNLSWTWPSSTLHEGSHRGLCLWRGEGYPEVEGYLDCDSLVEALFTPARVVEAARQLIAARRWCLDRVERLERAWQHDQAQALAALDLEFATAGLVMRSPGLD